MKTAVKENQSHASEGDGGQAEAHYLNDDGTIPNNPQLPLLVYKGVFDPANLRGGKAIEQTLKRNGWTGLWRNGIYSYHHYHSTAHEVLAVYAGSATVKLGGERGIVLTLSPGDALVVPAGVAHKNLESSPDFGVIGAYPGGQEWDMCYGKPGERPGADENISKVPMPKADPVLGREGPLMRLWKQAR